MKTTNAIIMVSAPQPLLDESRGRFCIRPNRHILVTHLCVGELYELDVQNLIATPRVTYKIPRATATLSLCPVPGLVDQYSLVTSEKSDPENCRWDDFAVWHLDFSRGNGLKLTRRCRLAIASFPMAYCSLDAHYSLFSDASSARIHLLNIKTGQWSVLLTHKLEIKPVNMNESNQITQIHATAQYIWYTISGTGTLYRVPYNFDPVDPSTPLQIRGDVEIVSDYGHSLEAFQVTADENTVFGLNSVDGSLIETDLRVGTRSEAQQHYRKSGLTGSSSIAFWNDSCGEPRLCIIYDRAASGLAGTIVSWRTIVDSMTTDITTTITSATDSRSLL
ncbi:hypothetical protein AB5N19_07058 [Seiridium cardinale]|uniref:Uncharacterized protein n=1 Tax=Seiridium cardinale TaxID=138064 RepID=A0ABR2XL59_9PEZI